MELYTIVNPGTNTEEIIKKEYSKEQCETFSKILRNWVFEVYTEATETRSSIKGYSRETYELPPTVEKRTILLDKAIICNGEVIGARFLRHTFSLNFLFKNAPNENITKTFCESRSGNNDSYLTQYNISVRLKEKTHLVYTICSEDADSAKEIKNGLFIKKEEYALAEINTMLESLAKEWVVSVSTSKLYSHDDYGDTSEFVERKELAISEEMLLIENNTPVGCIFGNKKAILFKNADTEIASVYGEWYHETRLMSVCYEDDYKLNRIDSM